MRSRRDRNYHAQPWLALSLVIFLIHFGVCWAESEEHEKLYLYRIMPPGEYDPIIDYVPPNNSTKNNMGGSELEKPSFLYSKTGPAAVARVVEFYAPWCPHCKHFAPKYVEFARRMREIVKPYGVEIDFYAVSCVANKLLCKSQGVRGYPTVKVIKANSNNATETKYYDLHPFQVLREIGIAVDMVEAEKGQPQQSKGTDSKKHVVLADLNKPKRSKADIYGDAYRSFHFAMKTGVFMTTGSLPNATADVLHNWLSLLQDTLPPTWNIHNLLKKLLDEFDSVAQGEDNMLKILDQYPPASKEWSLSCTHGEEAMGYTCGLWELFHIMSVGVVEYNEKIVTDDGYSFYRTETVADDLRNYIANFFGCEVCRMNFLQSYDTCAFDRCNRLHKDVGDLAAWKQFPLYLFEVHNAVNVRLMKEEAERNNRQPTHQDEMKAQWPSRLECPKCWNVDGSWDEEIIYKYLFDQYWPDVGKVSEANRRALFHPTIVVEPEDIENEGTYFMTIFKYGPILALVIAFCYMYRRRSYIAKTGRHKRAY